MCELYREGVQADALRSAAGSAAILDHTGVSSSRQVPQQAGSKPQLVQELGESRSSTEGLRKSGTSGSSEGTAAKSDGHQEDVSAALLHPVQDMSRDSGFNLNPGQPSKTAEAT